MSISFFPALFILSSRESTNLLRVYILAASILKLVERERERNREKVKFHHLDCRLLHKPLVSVLHLLLTYPVSGIPKPGFS